MSGLIESVFGELVEVNEENAAFHRYEAGKRRAL